MTGRRYRVGRGLPRPVRLGSLLTVTNASAELRDARERAAADGCELVDLRARRATQLESDEGKRLALAGRALLATRERSDDLARKVFAVACGVPVEDVERIPTPDVPGLVEVVGAGVDFLCLSTLVERVPSDPFLRAVTSLVREARGGGPTIVNVDAWA